MVDGAEDGSSMICTWKSSQQCRCRICIIQVPVSREQTWNNHMVTTLDCREGLHVQNKFSSFLRVWFGIVMQDIGVSYLKSCFFFQNWWCDMEEVNMQNTSEIQENGHEHLDRQGWNFGLDRCNPRFFLHYMSIFWGIVVVTKQQPLLVHLKMTLFL